VLVMGDIGVVRATDQGARVGRVISSGFQGAVRLEMVVGPAAVLVDNEEAADASLLFGAPSVDVEWCRVARRVPDYTGAAPEPGMICRGARGSALPGLVCGECHRHR
jgi:hypothetical protein